MYPKSTQKLIDIFSKFPTVGPKTAARFVFYLIKQEKKDIKQLIKGIEDLKKNIKTCSFCFNSFESLNEEKDFCQICQNPQRDKSLLCIVEKETDLIFLEKTKSYNGLYFILGGTVSKLRKKDFKKLRIEKLKERIKKDSKIKEIIIAVNPTTEGEATALYLERSLKSFGATQGKKITRLGRGLPMGGELEYADEKTLKEALEGRK